MVNSRLYFSYGERSKSPVVVGLSVVVRPEVEKKLSRVDIALVMPFSLAHRGVQLPR